MLNDDYAKLKAVAMQTAENAYAPYSKFRVGAAVLTASSKIFKGTNVENASYGLTICAERVALASAICGGEHNIVAICIACIDSHQKSQPEEKVPCGACRQWIQELAPEADIILAGEERIFKIRELLPFAFKLRKR